MFKNALVSVSDKTGLVAFLKPYVAQGLRVVSTGGTFQHLKENGIPVIDISEQTGFPEVMGGRVKTLHPHVHMAILSRLDHPEDDQLLKVRGLAPFDLVICNPPFHTSLDEVHEAAKRKWKNLKVKTEAKPFLNFAGQSAELIYPGGEEAFVSRMILQSAQLYRNAYWYTSLISKESALKTVRKALKNVKAVDVRILNMSQGQKQSRIVAWTFLNETEQRNWREGHWWNS